MSDSRPSVLLIDDEYGTIELIGAALERQGLDVSLAKSPRAAANLMRSVRFDAVVTDVVFDGRAEGEGVLEAAREHCADAVVVLMTGYPLIEGAVSAIKGGAIDYLQKPVDPQVLATTLRRALRERRFRSESLEFQDLVDILSDMVAHTIERVDPYTAGHGERTRLYSRMIAAELGLDTRTTERLELAAIAHDYGKIYLDDLTFLTKQGPLTPQEYKAVQRHPELGAEKLGRHEHLAEVCRYVAEHHERWDGTGYPRRKKGEEISPAGRVLCIVEVFDSLSTRRSYKEPWDLPKTMEFFSAQSGRAFDPDVADIFLALLDKNGDEWLAAPERDRQRRQAAAAV